MSDLLTKPELFYQGHGKTLQLDQASLHFITPAKAAKANAELLTSYLLDLPSRTYLVVDGTANYGGDVIALEQTLREQQLPYQLIAVELEAKIVPVLQSNLAQYQSRVTVKLGNSVEVIDQLIDLGTIPDLVYLDPPFRDQYVSLKDWTQTSQQTKVYLQTNQQVLEPPDLIKRWLTVPILAFKLPHHAYSTLEVSLLRKQLASHKKQVDYYPANPNGQPAFKYDLMVVY